MAASTIESTTILLVRFVFAIALGSWAGLLADALMRLLPPSNGSEMDTARTTSDGQAPELFRVFLELRFDPRRRTGTVECGKQQAPAMQRARAKSKT
jgi:hypothetical protein